MANAKHHAVLLSTLANALHNDSDFKVEAYKSKVIKGLKTLAKKS
jgi:hypothetical protein